MPKSKITNTIKQLQSELEDNDKESKSIEFLSSDIKELKGAVVDSNEELIATFVEGTKRLIKKPASDITPSIKSLEKTTSTKLDNVKSGISDVERAVKEIKLPSNVDFRATGAMLKLPIKELTRSIQSFEIPKGAEEAIPVRLSDGKAFYKALDQIIQMTTGGGGSSYAFHDSHKSPGKGLIDDDSHLQVDVLTLPAEGIAQPTVDSYTHASINLSAGANQPLVSSSASHQIWVYGFGFVVSVAGTVSFQDEDDLAISGVMPFAANSGMAVPPSGNFAMPVWKLATDKDLEVDLVTCAITGWIDWALVNA
jgi:hypothetical protein